MTAKSQDQGKQPIALEQRDTADDGRLHSPSAARNKHVICDVWLELGPRSGRVLEIGSGTGEHAVTILASCPDLVWTTSDLDPASRRSQAAWAAHEGLTARIDGPLELDASQPATDWGVAPGLAGLYCANMIHIAPWVAGQGVIRGAGALLASGGRLVFYGPFSRDGVHTAPSNAEFDANLKARHPDWGVRDLEGDVMPLAQAAGLTFVEARPMPANNFVVVFEKT